MRELSLHILDIMQNSIAAGASRVVVAAEADTKDDLLTLRVSDNGRGMDRELAAKVMDPFVTTRTTRKVGLGIPLLAAAAETCGGGLRIESEPGKGTVTEAGFALRHIDRMPYGDIVSTIINTVVSYPEIAFRYEHSVDGRVFAFDTDEINAQLEGIPITEPAVVQWMREYMEQGIASTGTID